MKRLLMICLVAMFCGKAFSDDRPPWLRGEMPQTDNSSYYFKICSGEGSTPTEARNNAILELVGELARAQGVTIKGRDIMISISRQQTDRYTERTTLKSTYNIESGEFRARFDVADEYHEKGRCYLLFEVAYNPSKAQFDKIELTRNYKGSSVWRSALVPGWGQMFKRQTGKGIAILTTQILSITGIVVCDNMAANYRNKATNEWDNGVRQQYEDLSRAYTNVRNGCIVAAGAIYIYNIIDAAVSKGAPRYANRKIALLPYATPQIQGVQLAIKF